MLSAAGLDLEVEDIHHHTGFLVEPNDVAPISTLAQSGGGGGSICPICV
jgi:hypothetical protein